MNPDTYVRTLYGHVDHRDAQALGELLADDVTFQLGNAEPTHGREAVIAGNASFFESVAGMAHTIDNVWSTGHHIICEGTVTYTRHDQTQTSARFATVLGLEGDLISDYKVYADISQL